MPLTAVVALSILGYFHSAQILGSRRSCRGQRWSVCVGKVVRNLRYQEGKSDEPPHLPRTLRAWHVVSRGRCRSRPGLMGCGPRGKPGPLRQALHRREHPMRHGCRVGRRHPPAARRRGGLPARQNLRWLSLVQESDTVRRCEIILPNSRTRKAIARAT